MQTSIEFLKKMPIFSQLSDGVLSEIYKLQKIKQYTKGTIIFTEVDLGEAFFFIRSGKVKVYKTSSDGRDITLNILGEGAIFAEVTLFNDINYPATVEVLEDSSIGMILNKDIEKLILCNTELALQIIKILNKRLLRSQMTIKEMAFHDTYYRTGNTLLHLCETHGKKTALGIEIDVDISRQDLANMIGTSRETASRMLSEFKKTGIINTDSKKIIITNKDKLKKLLED